MSRKIFFPEKGKPMESNDQTAVSPYFRILSEAQIEKVGPGGNFISEEHTFQNFCNFWEPSILDRTIAAHESEDKKEIHSEALLKERTLRLLESHEPQRLPEKMEQEIRRVEISWFDRLGLNYDQLSL
jgi:hypothetical protein